MRVVGFDIKAVPDFERGDIIVDAGNSYRAGSIRRHKRIAEKRKNTLLTLVQAEVWRGQVMPHVVGWGEREPIARVEP